MKSELQTILVKLNQHGYSQAELARELNCTTRTVNHALSYWVGRENYVSSPRSAALRVLLKASAILGEPVTPAINSVFKPN